MKKILFTFIAVMVTIPAFSQEISESIIKAEYPEGEKALMEFLSSNVKYPVDAQNAKVQGRVIVEFIIESDGKISETKVLKSVCESCDKEAMRVIKSMPAWNPAKRNGKAVKSKYIVPVIFRLNNAETKEVKFVNEFGDIKDEA